LYKIADTCDNGFTPLDVDYCWKFRELLWEDTTKVFNVTRKEFISRQECDPFYKYNRSNDDKGYCEVEDYSWWPNKPSEIPEGCIYDPLKNNIMAYGSKTTDNIITTKDDDNTEKTRTAKKVCTKKN
jgi:hypothetical protein